MLGVGLAVLALVIAALWGSTHPPAAAPAAPPASGLHPLEARLLATAAREPESPLPYLQLAEEYAASERPASTLWAYREAAARAPVNGAIHLKTAATLVQMGFHGSAETLLRSALTGGDRRAAPPGAPIPARLELAELLLSTGRPKAALEVLNPVGSEAEVLRGRAHEAAGDLEAAARPYRLAGAAGDPEGYERLVRLELARDRVVPAREAARSMAALRSPRPRDLLLVAAAHAAGGSPQDLENALSALLRCAQLQPRNAEAYYQAGLLFQRKGDRAAALAQFERAVKLDPNHAAARGQLADLLEASGRKARAHRERAAYFTLTDQPDRSLAELRRAGAAGYANDLERTLMAARTASELQQLPAAVKEAKEGLKRHPRNPELMLQLGLLYQQGGSREALEQLCREWRAHDPATGMPDWLLGRRAVTATRSEEAIRLFEAACAKEPQRADFCSALGLAYSMVPTPENLSLARKWLEKAVALNPRSAPAHHNLGRLLMQAGELEEARRQYLQSLDVQPGQPEVLNHLVQVTTRLGSAEVARLFAELARTEEERRRERRRLSRRVRDYPAEVGPRLEYAHFLIRNGQLAAAKNQLERAAEANPAAARQSLAEVVRLLRVQAGS